MKKQNYFKKIFKKENFNLNFNKEFFKIPNLLFGYIFKNPKVYILNFVLPPLLTYAVIYLWNLSFDYTVYPPMFFNMLLITVLMNMVFFSFIMVEWKHSILLNRIKLKGFSKIEIVGAIYLVFFTVMVGSFLFSFTLFALFSTIPWYSPYINSVKDFIRVAFSNLTFYNGFFSALILLMLSLFSVSLIILIPMLIDKKGWAKVTMLLVFLFAAGFSEIFINSQWSSGIYWWNYISYLSPWKYFSWYALYINSYATINFRGIGQVIDQLGQPYLSFSSVLIPSLVASLLTIIFPVLTYKFFKFGGK